MNDNNDPCDDSDGDEYYDGNVDHEEEEDKVAVMVTMVMVTMVMVTMVGRGSWCLQLGQS